MTITSAVEQLRQKKCVPCEGGVPRLTTAEAQQHLAGLPGWVLVPALKSEPPAQSACGIAVSDRSANPAAERIRKEWVVQNFMAAIEFFQRVAALAEAEGHHPDLHLQRYRHVTVEIWTHAIGGLSENDFILAAKIDELNIREFKKPVPATE